MDEKTTFKLLNNEGVEIECEVLFTFEDRDTEKNYVLYTDGSTEDNGNTKVYAAVYDPDEESPRLQPIETEEEWNLIAEILDTLQQEYFSSHTEDDFFDYF